MYGRCTDCRGDSLAWLNYCELNARRTPLLKTESEGQPSRGMAGVSSSGSKRIVCTGADGCEHTRTVRLHQSGVMNSSRQRCRGGGDRRFGLNSYSKQSFRAGQLKRTQANSSEITPEVWKAERWGEEAGIAVALTEDSAAPGLRSVTYMPDHEGAWSKSLTVTTLQLLAALVGRTGGGGDRRAVAVDHSRGSTQAGVWAHNGLPADRERRAGRGPSGCGSAHTGRGVGAVGRAQAGFGGEETVRAGDAGWAQGRSAAAAGNAMNCRRQMSGQSGTNHERG